MRAFVVKELAHPSKISLSHDVPEPTPGPEEVIVEVYSAALNFFDVSYSPVFLFELYVLIEPPSFRRG